MSLHWVNLVLIKRHPFRIISPLSKNDNHIFKNSFLIYFLSKKAIYLFITQFERGEIIRNGCRFIQLKKTQSVGKNLILQGNQNIVNEKFEWTIQRTQENRKKRENIFSWKTWSSRRIKDWHFFVKINPIWKNWIISWSFLFR